MLLSGPQDLVSIDLVLLAMCCRKIMQHIAYVWQARKIHESNTVLNELMIAWRTILTVHNFARSPGFSFPLHHRLLLFV